MNVDLEIGARKRADLEPLLVAIDGKLFDLFRGRLHGLYCAHFEVLGPAGDANKAIHGLAAAIEALPAPARRAWDRALQRDFNVGVELARRMDMLELAIERDAVERVAALGGRIVFTAYQPF
jgi:hypothetical protein